MQKTRVYNFVVLIEQDSEGWFVAKVPDIQGRYTQGKTIHQVLDRIKEAIQVCLEAEDTELSLMRVCGQ
ncbi:MAG TPA: type II toxin-antitoxin system HicB family antitoxin [archaeon]|nr:type II toxin-antitoxin system HicB family antitoxin [archaeon]